MNKTHTFNFQFELSDSRDNFQVEFDAVDIKFSISSDDKWCLRSRVKTIHFVQMHLFVHEQNMDMSNCEIWRAHKGGKCKICKYQKPSYLFIWCFRNVSKYKNELIFIRYALKKNTGLFWNFSQHGGGLPNSQNFCKFTKYFFVCQIHSEVLKHVLQMEG